MTAVCFTIALNGYDSMWAECIDTQERYCRSKNITYFKVSSVPWVISSRQSAWLKVMLLRLMLTEGAQTVAFLDADCEVRSHAPHFESAMTGSASVFLAPGRSGRLNSGVVFVRSAPAAIDFLTLLMAESDRKMPPEDHTLYENGHFIHYSRRSTAVGSLDHSMWNNNSALDRDSYIQHYAGGVLRKDYERRKKWDMKARDRARQQVELQCAAGGQDLTSLAIGNFLRRAEEYFSPQIKELLTK